MPLLPGPLEPKRRPPHSSHRLFRVAAIRECSALLSATSRITNWLRRSIRICISMAFSKGLSDRPDSGLIYRPQQSPREDAPYPTSATTFPSPLSPLRNLSLAATAAEGRASLQRRFTTNALPTLSPIAQQRRQAADPAMTVSPSLIFPCFERGGSIYTEL